MALTSTTIGKKGPSLGKKPDARTRADIYRDLISLGLGHNGDTFTASAWLALDLLKSPNRAKTHFLAITVSRNFESRGPRDTYNLIDAEALPLSLLDDRGYQDIDLADTHIGKNPREILRRDEEGRLRDDADVLGSALVLLVELNDDEKKRSVRTAVEKSAVPTSHPLGLFKLHQQKVGPLAAMPGMGGPRGMWKQCLKNGLAGGHFSPRYMGPYTPPPEA